MYFVYLLRSRSNPKKTYIGFTNELNRRILEHNQGISKTTKFNSPWNLEVSIAFKDREKALKFEKYLKRGSGHGFAKRHFWSETDI